MKKNNSVLAFSLILIFVMLACNMPGVTTNQGGNSVPPTTAATDMPAVPASATPANVTSPTATVAPSPTPELPTPTKTTSPSRNKRAALMIINSAEE